MGAADEELVGDQQLEKTARSRRGVAESGFPKSLGNKGVASWGVRDSATSVRACHIARSLAFSLHCNTRVQFNAEEIRPQRIACEGGRRHGKEATQIKYIRPHYATTYASCLGPHLFSIARAQRCITYVRRILYIASSP